MRRHAGDSCWRRSSRCRFFPTLAEGTSAGDRHRHGNARRLPAADHAAGWREFRPERPSVPDLRPKPVAEGLATSPRDDYDEAGSPTDATAVFADRRHSVDVMQVINLGPPAPLLNRPRRLRRCGLLSVRPPVTGIRPFPAQLGNTIETMHHRRNNPHAAVHIPSSTITSRPARRDTPRMTRPSSHCPGLPLTRAPTSKPTWLNRLLRRLQIGCLGTPYISLMRPHVYYATGTAPRHPTP